MRGLLFTLIIFLFAGWIAAVFASSLGVYHIELSNDRSVVCKGDRSEMCASIPPLLAKLLEVVGVVGTYDHAAF